MSQNNSSGEQVETLMNCFRKLWTYRKYINIEPIFFFYVMPSIFNSVAIRNFPLEKACRANFGYNKNICEAIFDVEFDCSEFEFDNIEEGASPEDANLIATSLGFNYAVCKAAFQAEKLEAEVNGKRALLAKICPLIVLIFAGSWADRYNKRKACMILPICGEMLSFSFLLISALFFDSFPMEFGAYLEAMLSARFGGLTLTRMAVYSYMTLTTPKEDRIFRFGIFGVFVASMPLIGDQLVIAEAIFQKLGYASSFAAASALELIAILYLVFFIDEVKTSDSKDAPLSPAPAPLNAAENLCHQTTQLDDVPLNKNARVESRTSRNWQTQNHVAPKRILEKPRKSKWRKVLHPTLLIDCAKFPFLKREDNGRILLSSLIMAYFLTVGALLSESDYFLRYALFKLNWDGPGFRLYSTFSTILTMVGTFIGAALLSKLWKCSDCAIGILAALSIVASRIVFAFAKDSRIFYIAGVVDMFASLCALAIRAIGSGIVADHQIGKFYSAFGISELIGQFLFPPLYKAVHRSTLTSFPGAIFLFGEIFYVPNVVVFALLLRRNKNEAERNTDLNPESELPNL